MKLWSRLFESLNPTLVIADYAPAALMAARGRYPTIALGNGFTLPPAELKSYPPFFNRPDPTDASVSFKAINRALKLAKMRTIDHLPEIFEADYSACITLEIADGYRKVRKKPAIGYLHRGPIPRAEPDGNDAIFVYLTVCRPELRRLVLQSMARLDRPSIIYSLQNDDEDDTILAGSQVQLIEQPMPLDRIITESRLVVHLGSHNLSLELLIAGMPSLNLTIDIEKVFNAAVLKQAGLMYSTNMNQMKTSDQLIETIQDVLDDHAQRDAITTFADSLPADTHHRALDSIMAAIRDMTD